MNFPIFETRRACKAFPSSINDIKGRSCYLDIAKLYTKFRKLPLPNSKQGIKAGKRTKVDCFTEVVFNNSSQANKRPDGLIVNNTGAQTKSSD